MGSGHARNEAMKDVFMRCHEKTAVQVCTLIIMHYCPVIVNIHTIANFRHWRPYLTTLCMDRI
jgi:hypothetical protein